MATTLHTTSPWVLLSSLIIVVVLQLLEADADRESVSNMVPDRRPYPKRDLYGYDPAHHFTMDHLLHP